MGRAVYVKKGPNHLVAGALALATTVATLVWLTMLLGRLISRRRGITAASIPCLSG